MKRWGAMLAIILLVADILGRFVLVATGLYPIDTLENTFSIIAGTAIAGVFALYIGWKWKCFN
jgi:Na+/H+ antiporter NhaC